MKTPSLLKLARLNAVAAAHRIKTALQFIAVLPPELILFVLLAFVCGVML